MIADLHCHSHCSDGTLAPAALVARAAARGVDMLALTDHDTVDGLAEAQAAATAAGITFITGIEFSCRWDSRDIHVVGLNIDPVALVAALDAQQDARRRRAVRIGERLAKAGAGSVHGRACELAGHDRPGRPHFARALVEAGQARDHEHAFNRFLKQGQSAYVSTEWASVEQAAQWITAAGGVAVVAHPARYGLTRTKLKKLLEAFAGAGGGALEVRLPNQQPNQVQSLVDLAAPLGLAGSIGSDYHGGASPWCDLGCAGQLPAGIRPVWELWA